MIYYLYQRDTNLKALIDNVLYIHNIINSSVPVGKQFFPPPSFVWHAIHLAFSYNVYPQYVLKEQLKMHRMKQIVSFLCRNVLSEANMHMARAQQYIRFVRVPM